MGISTYNVASPLKYIKLLHRSTDGYITFFRKIDADKVKQYHYKLDQLNEQMLNEWVAKDSFVSLNSFFIPKRSIKTLRTLHNLYVDIDCTQLGLSVDAVLYELEHNYYDVSIPKPNLVLYSGRNVSLIWNIKPISGLAIDRFDEMQAALCNLLKEFGADAQAKDAARIFRLAGSVNSKNNAVVRFDHLHDYEYDFYEIAEQYFPDMKCFKRFKEKQNKAPKRSQAHSEGRKRKVKVSFGFNSYSLLQSRLCDFEQLIKLRNGNMEGHRERILFLVRLYALSLTNSDEAAIQKMYEVNSLFSAPLKDREVIQSTASALGYHKNGGLHISTKKLVEWFDITEEEMRQLSTIIDKNEKRSRNTASKRKARRAAGVQSMEQYNATRKRSVLRQLKRLKLVLATYPKASQRQLAAIMGVSQPYIKKLLSRMGELLQDSAEQVITDVSALVGGGSSVLPQRLDGEGSLGDPRLRYLSIKLLT